MNSKSSRTACVEAACSATSYFDVGKNRAEEEKYHKPESGELGGGCLVGSRRPVPTFVHTPMDMMMMPVGP